MPAAQQKHDGKSMIQATFQATLPSNKQDSDDSDSDSKSEFFNLDCLLNQESVNE